MCGNCDIIPAETDAAAKIDALFADYRPEFMPVQHTFCNGVYTRTGKIPAGTIIIGAQHRAKNIFHLAKGKVVVWDVFHGVRTLTAPFSEVTLPGTQRLGLVLEDIEGSNIFETDKTTVAEVESEMLFPFTVPSLVGQKILRLTNANPA
jgi:hypothetical protein